MKLEASLVKISEAFLLRKIWTSFKMTKELALEIKMIKTNGSTFRSVVDRFLEKHPDLPVTRSQTEGHSSHV